MRNQSGGTANDPGHGARNAAGVAFDAMQGSLEFGVQSAYMVVDEYMRRGYEAASKFQPGTDWGQDMNQNQYGYGNSSSAQYASSAQMMQWTQIMQQAMGQWMQMLQMMQSMPLPLTQQMLEMMRLWMSSWTAMFPVPGMQPGYGYPPPSQPGMQAGYAYPPNPYAGMPGGGPSEAEMRAAMGNAASSMGSGGVPPNSGMPPGFDNPAPGADTAEPWDMGYWQPPPSAAPAPPGGMAAAAESAAGSAAPIRIQVHSHQPTEVIPNLTSSAEGVSLVVDALIASGHDADPIRGAIIQPDGDGHHIAVSVPPDQPPGRYSGSVRNIAGDYVGGLTVIVHPIASAID